ncbi:hypothetical protein JJL06_13940 [Staphylococcus aureus]|nr:hypothetical protein [Staphylococcus aureus]
MLFYQPLIQNEFQKQNMVDEKRIDIETKKANDDNTLANLNNLQSDLQDKTQNMYSNAGILFTTLVFGLLMSLVAFIIPAIVLSFSKVTLKKYRVLLAELLEKKYIYLSTNK